jgi:hypothetical protein
MMVSEMQMNKDFVLRKVNGMNVVLPTGPKVKDFGGALNLNDTAALIFEQLQAGKTVEETVSALVAAYDVSPETALADVQETIESLREAGVVA